MHAIEAERVTKDYGGGKGVFDISLSVKKGEVFGFLGPNGAGKTTTIRQFLGFIRPESGSCRIQGMDCFKNAASIQKDLGYLAGEIAFLEDFTGTQLLKFLADMKGIKDLSRMHELISFFDFDPSGKVKKMSKGMKQKAGLVSAFMGNPSIAILDEPTSGLDPLMQNRFVDLILQEKAKGTTILMSSHLFDEVERTCSRTAIIREGKLVCVEDMDTMKKRKNNTYIVTFSSEEAARKAQIPGIQVLSRQENKMTVRIKENMPAFLSALSCQPVTDIEKHTETLEEIFLHFYGESNSKDALRRRTEK